MADVPTREEVRDAIKAATAAALAITKSRQLADELVQDAFERVLTTRPWSRDKGPFDRHLVGAVSSLASHGWASKRPEQDLRAHEGFQQEVVGLTAPSPETKTLERAEEEDAQARAEAELDALEASVAGNDAAVAVLRCRREHALTKAADIAAKLGMPQPQVYRANELLRDHLQRLRKKRKDDE
jgi:DNA-directed RNA polymerase specialized sigma24 family protein